MGHHGWQGNPPRTEEDARTRIVQAAMACIDRHGAEKTTLSDVANSLGITRQTVYRYFPSVSELFNAVALVGADDFVRRMEEHLAQFPTAAEAAIESVVFAIQAIPQERHIGLLVQVGETDIFSRGATSAMAVSLGGQILRRIPVDWSAIGITDQELEGLAEILMRLFVSYLQYPASPPRTEDELRKLVRRWLGPALSGPDLRVSRN